MYDDLLAVNAGRVWAELQLIYPALNTFPLPIVRINNRLRTTGGRAWQETRIIEIANWSLKGNYRYTMRSILPHELIHQADYDLNGDSDLKCGHGAAWVQMMVEYGLYPSKYCV